MLTSPLTLISLSTSLAFSSAFPILHPQKPTNHSLTSIYPLEGIDFPVPQTGLTLTYRPFPSPIPPIPFPNPHHPTQFPLALIISTTNTALLEISYLIHRSTPDAHFIPGVGGPVAGIFRALGMELRFTRATEDIELQWAIVAVGGVQLAARDMGFVEEASILVKLDRGGGGGEGVVEIARLDMFAFEEGREEGSVEVD